MIWVELILEPSHVISDFANVPDVGKEREREASSGYRRLDSNLPKLYLGFAVTMKMRRRKRKMGERFMLDFAGGLVNDDVF